MAATTGSQPQPTIDLREPASWRKIKELPIDTIKIDRSLVANLASDQPDAAIVASVVSLAAALGLGVVAEGVESQSQAALLRDLGCPLAQGFLFGRPASSPGGT